MSVADLRLGGPSVGVHPALLNRRIRGLAVTGATALVVLLIAMAVSVAVPNPSPLLAIAAAAGAVGVVALMVSTRYEVTLTIVVLYLGLLDGPVKLIAANTAASAFRDVLIAAITIGMLMRLAVSKERVSVPPLSGWVFAFVAAVVMQAFNPATGGFLKIIGGFRQELEWVPFFFFGYLMMRSKASLRKLFLVFGVLAVANGAVGAYQTRLTPKQLGSWGPGYSTQAEGGTGVAGRTYVAEGEGKPRPPALGSDAGFGGGIGVLALPGLLAMLATGQLRRRWIAVVLCAGALLAIATAASRSSVIIAVVAVASYVGLSFIARLPVTRPLAGLLAVMALAVGIGAALVSADGKGIFKRQKTVTSISAVESSGANAKAERLTQIPRDIYGAPLGVGLAIGGSAGGFGGKQKVRIEGEGTTKEAAYSLVALEVGAPGLLLWLGLTITVIALAVLRLPSIADVELRTYLVAIFAVYIAFTAEGAAGPTLAVSPAGTFLWFAPGIAAYWLARGGRGRAPSRATIGRSAATPPAIGAAAA